MNGAGALTASTLEKLQSLRKSGALAKATTTGILQSTGLTNYDLEAYAKLLFPVITPIRNSIPRAKGNGDTATHWKVITAINPGRTFAGAPEAHRGAYIDQTEADRTQSYKRLSLENYVSEEAILAAEGFDNALTIGQDTLLWSSMIAEEEIILTGNSTLALGTPAAPTGVDSGAAAGGNLANVAYKCRVVALTYEGYKRASLVGGLVTTFSVASADGLVTTTVNGGSSIASAASASVTPTAAHSITWSVTAIPGAFAYAWFVDVAANAASLVLAGITTINQFVQTKLATGTDVSSNYTVDHSTSSLIFDGLIVQAVQGSGQYSSLDGAGLTAQDGGVKEIDDVLQNFWESARVSPTKLWVNAQEARNITRAILKGGATPAFRFNVAEGAAQGTLTGGSLVTTYLNKFAPGGAKALEVEVHPNMPAGKIFFDCDQIPYPLANIPGARRMKARREYWSVLWPQTTMLRAFSVNVDELLQVYTPFAMGILDNCGNSVS